MGRLLRPGFAAALLAAAGCAGPARLAYTPDELRTELARRGVPAGEVVVPHQLDEARAAWARELAGRARSEAEKVHSLTEALSDPGQLGLRYQEGVTTTAAETLERGTGNCLGLAAVFIGLARAAGLQAWYMDASTLASETRPGPWDIAVTSGHVTAVVQVNDQKVGLDFGRLGLIRRYRIIDDVEALAHFYNNRGFERVDRGGGAAEAWRAAEPDFRLAVRVMPELGRAWNNLGMAAARQGRPREAEEFYRTAIARDPTLGAPWNNLGSLHLATGDLAGAEQDLAAAARLDPTASHIQYNLAVVRLKRGDRPGADQAVRRALALRPDYPEARALLLQLGGVAAPR